MTGCSVRVQRHPALAGVVVVLLIGASLFAGTRTAQADAGRPALARFALAEMQPDLATSQIGYGQADQSSEGRGGFAFAEWASPDSYFLGVAGRQLLVIATKSDKLVETSFDLGNHHRGRVRTASISGWTLTDAYMGPDGRIYTLLGRDNPTQSRTRTVIEVRQYDQNLHLLGVARVAGGADEMGVYDGVGDSAPDMDLSGTTLIVHMSRLIFHIQNDWADHHEVNLSLAVDTTTMTASEIADAPYASHSFNEYVGVSEDDLLFVDHGDAYPRGVQLGVMPDYLAPEHGRVWDAVDCGPTVGTPTDPMTGEPIGEDPSFCWTEPGTDDHMAFTVPKDDAALAHHDMTSVNYTGVTVNGFAVTESDALTVGLSVPNGHKVDAVASHSPSLMGNVFLTSTNTTTGATRLVWLTEREPKTKEFLEEQPALVDLGDGNFGVLWDEFHGKRVTMNYRLVSETGKVLAGKRWGGHAFAAVAQPVLAGSQIFWVGEASTKDSYDVANYLYGLDVTNPAKPALLSP
jgi:hypothetical protein